MSLGSKNLIANQVIAKPKAKVIGQKINDEIIDPKPKKKKDGPGYMLVAHAVPRSNTPSGMKKGGKVRGHGIARTRKQKAKYI